MDFDEERQEILLENAEKALKQTGLKTIALAGGVSANSYIRNEFLKLEKQGILIYILNALAF